VDALKTAFGAVMLCLAVYYTGRTTRLLLEAATEWVLDRLVGKVGKPRPKDEE
jgi:hypothetical protein